MIRINERLQNDDFDVKKKPKSLNVCSNLHLNRVFKTSRNFKRKKREEEFQKKTLLKQ